MSAARRIRSSVPSGSTRCRRAARARSIRSYSNISGVTRVDAVSSSAAARAEVSTCDSNAPSAAATFRGLSGPSRCSIRVEAAIVS